MHERLVETLKCDIYIKEEIEEIVEVYTVTTCIYACTHAWYLACMDAPFAHMLVGVCTFVLTYMLMLHMYACMHSYSLHVFLLNISSLWNIFINSYHLIQDPSNQQNKMSNITTEKKNLEQLTDSDLLHMFNSKVSSTVDDYLFNKGTANGGLKRKRETENIVGTKKSKKRLRRL